MLGASCRLWKICKDSRYRGNLRRKDVANSLLCEFVASFLFKSPEAALGDNYSLSPLPLSGLILFPKSVILGLCNSIFTMFRPKAAVCQPCEG